MHKLISLTILLSLLLISGCQEDSSSESPFSLFQHNSIKPLVPKAKEIVKTEIQSDSPYLRTHAIEVIAQTDSCDFQTYIIDRLQDASFQLPEREGRFA